MLALWPSAQAFDLLGSNLSVGQRDFRVYNNFTDADANNNTTPDPNFPGYTGAPLAIWKACVEWGSENHGDGTGDPSQPDGLGSGGANFDPSFQGLATGVGDTNDNIHSEISGSSGNVLAYAEAPFGSGWRIRYFENWRWIDGPDHTYNLGPITIDLQGVATHEYGHALGLGHTSAPNATMTPAASFGGIADRVIAPDDIAGVQAIYGVMSGSKPHIEELFFNSGVLTVVGHNFSPNGNDVWFTQAGSGGNGTPVQVTNLPSNGTEIFVTVPGNAGLGDVLVRNDDNGHASLSNAFPYDPGALSSCPLPQNYCTPLPNSVGTTGAIVADGSFDVSDNDFHLTASNVPEGQFGIFFYGPGSASFAFGDGVMCISGGLFRLPLVMSVSPLVATYTPDLTNLPPNGDITPGSTWNFQYWYRDPQGPLGTSFNLTDAVSVLFCQ
jgi:hypothetical protein